MPRTAPQYTIAFVDKDGDLDIATFGDDLDSAKERLATLPEGKARLWTVPPVTHRIRREPTVEIGEPPAPVRRRSTSNRRRKAVAEAPITSSNGGPVVTAPASAAAAPPAARTPEA